MQLEVAARGAKTEPVARSETFVPGEMAQPEVARSTREVPLPLGAGELPGEDEDTGRGQPVERGLRFAAVRAQVAARQRIGSDRELGISDRREGRSRCMPARRETGAQTARVPDVPVC